MGRRPRRSHHRRMAGGVAVNPSFWSVAVVCITAIIINMQWMNGLLEVIEQRRRETKTGEFEK